MSTGTFITRLADVDSLESLHGLHNVFMVSSDHIRQVGSIQNIEPLKGSISQEIISGMPPLLTYNHSFYLLLHYEPCSKSLANTLRNFSRATGFSSTSSMPTLKQISLVALSVLPVSATSNGLSS